MKALLFGAPPAEDEVRPTPPEDEVEAMLARIPFGLHEIDDARLVRPDWVVTRPILSGICGSDAKLVLGDFNTGDIDNPMAAFSSLPHVPGHEVVAEVVALGPEARGLDVGQRVVLNPWLTCGPRGIDPPCPPCQRGDLSLCWSFTKGDLGPGVHVGVITGAPGAWAEQLAAHDSMLIPVPDGISDEAAVLADPFSVSFHAIVRHPPPPSGRVLVYGAGALGLTSVAILRALHPDVEVGVVARFDAQREMALAFGASAVFAHEPRLALVEALAEWSGAVLHAPLDGLPVTHPGHIDVVYDSIAKAETLEVGVRVLAERGQPRLHRGRHPRTMGVDPHLLQGDHHRGVERLRDGGLRGPAPARHRALPPTGRGGPARHHAHAHPPLRTRGVVARAQGAGPAGPERCPEGGLHTQRVARALSAPVPSSLKRA